MFGRLGNREPVLLFAMTVLVVSSLFYLFWFRPQNSRLQTLNNELAQRRQAVHSLQTFALSNPDPQKTVNVLKQRLTRLNLMLPDSPAMSTFLLTLEEDARMTGVQIVFVQPSSPKTLAGYAEISLDITVKGGYEQICAFVRKVEDGERFAAVLKTTIKGSGSDLVAQFTFLVYTSNSNSAIPLPEFGHTDQSNRPQEGGAADS